MTSVHERHESVPSPPPGPSRPKGLGLLGWLRWSWRQLTSMRTALLLLMLLAVLAVPGSYFPQRRVDQSVVVRYIQDNPRSAPWLDRLYLFDVYNSPWFSAVYLLLFISLVGCVLPRTRVHLANLRQPPPRTPARLAHLPEHRAIEVHASPQDVLDAARAVLGERRYRAASFTDRRSVSLAGQKGDLRESGNLLFHLALVGVVVAVGVGGLWGYRAQVVTTVGEGYVNSTASYDTWDPGTLVDPDALPPFSFVLDQMSVVFEDDPANAQYGTPRDFRAEVTVIDAPGGQPRTEAIRVNEPLRAGGASVYLAGNGYAPVISVRDGNGTLVYDQPTVFFVRDDMYTSTGVVKVPDAATGQVGLQGLFLPTANVDPVQGPISTYPDLGQPELYLTAFTGDLGLDRGAPQNAYELDTSRMRQLNGSDGTPLRIRLALGETVQLPEGLGTVTFDSVDRFAGFTVRHDPARGAALAFSLLAITGLTVSLFVPRRRVWVRASAAAPGAPATAVRAGQVAAEPRERTLLEVGALARSEDHGLGGEADAVFAAVLARLFPPAQASDPNEQDEQDEPGEQNEPSTSSTQSGSDQIPPSGRTLTGRTLTGHALTSPDPMNPRSRSRHEHR